MDLDETKLRQVPDGGILHTLANGIAIVRRRKHEPQPKMDDWPADQLKRLTDKEYGSKFLPGTTLARIVEMTAEVLLENGAEPGSNCGYNKVWPTEIGVSFGKRVRGMWVRRSKNGKLAHGIPVDETSL